MHVHTNIILTCKYKNIFCRWLRQATITDLIDLSELVNFCFLSGLCVSSNNSIRKNRKEIKAHSHST